MKILILTILIVAVQAWTFSIGYQMGLKKALVEINREVIIRQEIHDLEIDKLLQEFIDQDCDDNKKLLISLTG